ncbi:MAG: hypothetical protein ISQ14_06650 [Verrucomicrobiae bacterium]|nr:hypothetical protein [Verrucomicrobiae bacterium]
MKIETRTHSHPAAKPARRILILHSRALSQLVAIQRRCGAKSAAIQREAKTLEATA